MSDTIIERLQRCGYPSDCAVAMFRRYDEAGDLDGLERLIWICELMCDDRKEYPDVPAV